MKINDMITQVIWNTGIVLFEFATHIFNALSFLLVIIAPTMLLLWAFDGFVPSAMLWGLGVAITLGIFMTLNQNFSERDDSIL